MTPRCVRCPRRPFLPFLLTQTVCREMVAQGQGCFWVWTPGLEGSCLPFHTLPS